MNTALDNLQPYPFEKLRALLGGARPPATLKPIALSIGEPKHRSPSFVAETLAENLTNSRSTQPPSACQPCAKPSRAGASGASRCRPAGWMRRATYCR